MAFLSSTSTTSNNQSRMFSLQILLFSFGVISAALILSLSLPALTEFVVTDLPSIWNSVTLWFKPPYLYVVINCIILMLIASSKFQHNYASPNADNNVPPLLPPSPADHISLDDEDELVDVGAVKIVSSHVEVARTFPVDSADIAHMEMIAIAKGEEDEKILFDDLKRDKEEKSGFDDKSAALSSRRWNLTESSVNWDEKPPRSTNRFTHRKPNKSNIDGGRSFSSLRVSKPKRYETLESTWKAITEGRAMPLARHKRKSETWQDEDRHNLGTDSSEMGYNLKEEGKELSSVPVSSRTRRKGKLKREASPGQDELNRRVEAFIKKFNEEMRLQRQRSLQQYKDMMRINVGGEGGTTS